jgi:hypothetical protein
MAPRAIEFFVGYVLSMKGIKRLQLLRTVALCTNEGRTSFQNIAKRFKGHAYGTAGIRVVTLAAFQGIISRFNTMVYGLESMHINKRPAPGHTG